MSRVTQGAGTWVIDLAVGLLDEAAASLACLGGNGQHGQEDEK